MGEFDYLYTPRPLPMLVGDPYDRERDRLSLAALARARDLGDIDIETKKRGVADDEVIRRLWPDLVRGGFSDEAIKQVLPQAGSAAPALVKLVGEQRKSMLDAKDKESQIRKQDVEAKSKAFDHISSVAFAEGQRPDQLSLQRIRSVAKTYGYELPDAPGDPRDPASLQKYMQSIGNMAYAAKDQVANSLTKDRDFNTNERGWATIDETGRHNKRTEDLGFANLGETTRHHKVSEGTAQDAAGVGTWSNPGFTPDGKPIYFNNKNPMLVTRDPGQPGMSPYSGQVISGTDSSKQVMGKVEAAKHLNQITQLENLVKENPKSFNSTMALAENFLPDVLPGSEAARNYMAKRTMSPEARVVRTQVMREAAQVINDLYGAALSRREGGMAATWAPSKNDDYDTTMVKLAGAKQYAQYLTGQGADAGSPTGGGGGKTKILKRPGE